MEGMYDLGHRFWLRRDGRYVMGKEEAAVLHGLREGLPLTEAISRAGISRGEWAALISKVEEAAGVPILMDGGLTDEGEELLCRFEGQARSARERLESAYRNPCLTADAVIIIDGGLVLVERGREPFKGSYALPGGFMNYGERAEECAVREVREETGLETMVLDLIGVYSSPDRDPRGHTVTAAFHMKARGGRMRSGDDAADVRLFPLDALPEMAFDHRRIVDDLLAMRGRKGI